MNVYCALISSFGMKVMTLSVCGFWTGPAVAKLLWFILTKAGAHWSTLSSLPAQKGHEAEVVVGTRPGKVWTWVAMCDKCSEE